MNNQNPENFNENQNNPYNTQNNPYANQQNNQYGYNPEYEMYPGNYIPNQPPKSKNNGMIIALITVVGILLCAIIVLGTVLIIRSNMPKNVPDPIPQVQEEEPEEVKDNNPIYVTCVSDAEILVRSGAGKGYSVVLTINGGDTSVKLKSTGNSTFASDGYIWYEVKTPTGQTAWVRSDVVTLDGPNPYQRKAVYNAPPVTGGQILVTKSYKSDIFVRSGPGKAYRVVYTISPGDTSKKLTTTGSAQYDSSGYVWYQVLTPLNQVAWVRSDIVTTASSSSSYSYSTYKGTLVTRSYNSSIYVRSGPGKSYRVVYTIGSGDTSKKLAYTGYSQRGEDGYVWYNVITPSGVNAWVRSDIVVFQ